MVLLAILSVTLFNTLLYVGLRHTEASNALLIASVLPLIILPLSKWMYDTPIRRAQVIGVSLSLLGIAAIISGGDWRVFATLAFNVGDLWVLAATLSWAFYSLWLRWKPAELSPIAFLTFSVIVGYLPLALLYWPEVATGLPLPHSQTQWLVIGYTGLFASLVAFLCWNHGVKQLGPAVAGQFIHLQMIFGTALAMLFLGEKLGGAELIGALLIGTGILLTTRRQRG
jgi:drug/metabolite transporter (DMT)-like permease